MMSFLHADAQADLSSLGAHIVLLFFCCFLLFFIVLFFACAGTNDT